MTKITNKLNKLLKLRQYKHNNTADDLFNLVEDFLAKESYTRIDYFELLLDISIITGREDYPILLDERQNDKFWNIIESLRTLE